MTTGVDGSGSPTTAGMRGEAGAASPVQPPLCPMGRGCGVTFGLGGCSQASRGCRRLLGLHPVHSRLPPAAAVGGILRSDPPVFNLVGACNIFPRLTLRNA